MGSKNKAAGDRDIRETSKEVMITSEDIKDTEGDAPCLTSKEVKCTFGDAEVTSEDEKDTEGPQRTKLKPEVLILIKDSKLESTAAGEKDISETSREVKIKSEDTKETEGDASGLTSKEVKRTFEDAGDHGQLRAIHYCISSHPRGPTIRLAIQFPTGAARTQEIR